MARPTGAKAYTQCKNFFISAFAPFRGANPITHLPRAPFLTKLALGDVLTAPLGRTLRIVLFS